MLLGGPALEIGDWMVRGRIEGGVLIAEAGASVWNARDAGGERARAKGVVPQLEVFSLDGRRLYHYIGWASTNRRDFPATREEERIKLAEKSDDRQHMLIGHHPPQFASSLDVVEGRITLRGDNLVRPITATFMMGLGRDGELWLDPS
jgi:hypothetical protein